MWVLLLVVFWAYMQHKIIRVTVYACMIHLIHTNLLFRIFVCHNNKFHDSNDNKLNSRSYMYTMYIYTLLLEQTDSTSYVSNYKITLTTNYFRSYLSLQYLCVRTWTWFSCKQKNINDDKTWWIASHSQLASANVNAYHGIALNIIMLSCVGRKPQVAMEFKPRPCRSIAW